MKRMVDSTLEAFKVWTCLHLITELTQHPTPAHDKEHSTAWDSPSTSLPTLKWGSGKVPWSLHQSLIKCLDLAVVDLPLPGSSAGSPAHGWREGLDPKSCLPFFPAYQFNHACRKAKELDFKSPLPEGTQTLLYCTASTSTKSYFWWSLMQRGTWDL